MFWEVIKTIIFGIVEGITEWLPVSSTGHLILLKELLGSLRTDEFWEMFEVLIQLGAIIAIIVIYFDKLNPFAKNNTYNTNPMLVPSMFRVAPRGIENEYIFGEIFNFLWHTSMVCEIAALLDMRAKALTQAEIADFMYFIGDVLAEIITIRL